LIEGNWWASGTPKSKGHVDTLLCVYPDFPFAEPGLKGVQVFLKDGGGDNWIWVFGKDSFVISEGG
jgi:hypothetical protein